MRIIELTLHGTPGERHWVFQPGLNLIDEPGVRAPKILGNSLVTMLYGPDGAPSISPKVLALQPARESPRSSRKKAKPREKKSPATPDFDRLDGTLLLTLDDDRKFRLRRRVIFDRDNQASTQNELQIFDASRPVETEVTAEYQDGQNFAERHLGLNRSLFVAAAIVRADALRVILDEESDSFAATLAQILDSASTRTSAHTAIQRLDRKLVEIGNLYSAGSFIAEAYKKRDALRQQQRAGQSAQRASIDDQAEAGELAAAINILQTRLAILERQSLAGEIDNTRVRLARYDDGRRQIEKIAAEQIALAEFKDFPASGKENFFQLHHELSHLHKLQELLAGERNALELKLTSIAERLGATGVDENIWERRNFEEFDAYRTQWQVTFEQILAIETAEHGADAALEAAGLSGAERAALAGLDHKRLEELKQREAGLKAEEQRVEKLRAAYEDFQSRAQNHRRLGAGVALLALAAVTSGVFQLEASASGSSNWSGVVSLLFSIGALALFLFLNYRWLLKSRQLAGELLRAENTYMANRQALRELIGSFQAQSVDELVRQRTWFVEMGSASREHAKCADELAKIESALLPWLQPLGLEHIAMETLAVAEKRWRESHQLWMEKMSAHQQLERIGEQMVELEKNRQRVAAAIELALAIAGIILPPGDQSFQAYVQACQKREYLDTLRAQSEQIEALGREILGGQRREQTVEELKRLEQSLQIAAEPRLSGDLEGALSYAQIRERIATLEREIAEQQQALAVNRERMQRREPSAGALPEIDEALVLVEDEIEHLHVAQQAMQHARNTILTARQRVHNDFAQRANALLNRYVQRLSQGRYISAKLNPTDFSIQLFRPSGTSEAMTTESLDIAMQQRLHLILRLAMPALMSESRESIPLLIETAPHHHASMDSGLDLLAEAQQIFCLK